MDIGKYNKPFSKILDVLTVEQSKTVSYILSGYNVCILGSGGTGKSFFIKYLCKILNKKYGKPYSYKVAVTSTTGISAIQINGTTINRFAGIQSGKHPDEYFLSDEHITSWKNLEILIIDEISMMPAIQFDRLERLAKGVRQSTKPFGGVQLILVGDCFQLPPVIKKTDYVEILSTMKERHINFYENSNSYIKDNSIMFFESNTWNNCIDTYCLFTRNFRQYNDNIFWNILQRLRVGLCDNEDKKLLRLQEYRSPDYMNDTILFSTHDAVSEHNEVMYRNIDCEENEYKAVDYDIIHFPKDSENEIELHKTYKVLDTLKKDLSKVVKTTLKLKLGCKVFLTKNINSTLVNGLTGVIEEFNEGLPVVNFPSIGRKRIRYTKFKIIHPRCSVKRSQIPLKLAWAMTIQKCQGMTINSAVLDLKEVYGEGVIYVAISRVQSLKDITIKGFEESMIKPRIKCIQFMKTVTGLKSKIKEINLNVNRILKVVTHYT